MRGDPAGGAALKNASAGRRVHSDTTVVRGRVQLNFGGR